jgi:sugar (pentulose or hexulose) kinase
VDAVGVDASILTRVVDNGVVVAELRKELATEIGARDQWPFVLCGVPRHRFGGWGDLRSPQH